MTNMGASFEPWSEQRDTVWIWNPDVQGDPEPIQAELSSAQAGLGLAVLQLAEKYSHSRHTVRSLQAERVLNRDGRFIRLIANVREHSAHDTSGETSFPDLSLTMDVDGALTSIEGFEPDRTPQADRDGIRSLLEELSAYSTSEEHAWWSEVYGALTTPTDATAGLVVGRLLDSWSGPEQIEQYDAVQVHQNFENDGSAAVDWRWGNEAYWDARSRDDDSTGRQPVNVLTIFPCTTPNTRTSSPFTLEQFVRPGTDSAEIVAVLGLRRSESIAGQLGRMTVAIYGLLEAGPLAPSD